MRVRAAAKLGGVGRVVPKAAEQGVQSRSEGGQVLLPTRRGLEVEGAYGWHCGEG